jgi:hypothetical protein
VIQEPSNNTPLLGVIDAMPTECKIF